MFILNRPLFSGEDKLSHYRVMYNITKEHVHHTISFWTRESFIKAHKRFILLAKPLLKGNFARYRPRLRHQMETFSVLLALCEWNPPVTGVFPSQRPVTRSFDDFVDLRLNKRLSKESIRRWFETTSCSLLRHCNVSVKSYSQNARNADRFLRLL